MRVFHLTTRPRGVFSPRRDRIGAIGVLPVLLTKGKSPQIDLNQERTIPPLSTSKGGMQG
jgi:hypothetical protein